MRVLKNTAQSYSSFSKSIQHLTRGGDKSSKLRLVNFESETSDQKLLALYNQTFQSIYLLHDKCGDASGISEVLRHLRNELKKVISFKEAELFFFDEKFQNLFSVDDVSNPTHQNYINKIHSEGIIDWVWESRKAKLILHKDSADSSEKVLNHLIIPVFNNTKNVGLLSLLTPVTKFYEEQVESKMINVLLGAVIPKVQLLAQRNELSILYSELQTSQSKLSNDYKLAAIGELSAGIYEEIISPLQVIMSHTEFLQKEHTDIEDSVILSIKKQLAHIKGLINRAVKFAEVNGEGIKISSCNLNDILSEFHNLLAPSLKASSYESVLDLEENIPTILSNQNYIYQLLANALSVLKPLTSQNGGILFQTRYVRESVILKIISTDFVDATKLNEKDLEIKIIHSIVRRHEGSFQVKSEPYNGSAIIISFPLKRKFRQ